MSAAQDSLLPLPSSWDNRGPSIQTQQPANDSGRIIFTRQLWQRTMPDEIQSDQSVLNRSHSHETSNVLNIAAGPVRRTSSVSSRSLRNSPTASQGSKAPLTPEESPPTRTTRKRNTGIVEQEDQDLDRVEIGSAHSRTNSDDNTHVCICQPDPKIPRPRNAFILYRQHHQANVISQHPGLSNPEISKIIGEQWQNQPPDIKGKWKALAEEEKLRHQAQYPTYRYQPKRSGRRNSITADGGSSAIEKPKCTKCGGKSILAPLTPYSHLNTAGTSPSGPHTPGSALTPISRTLPVLRDLSLQSPALRRTGRAFPNSAMSPGHHLEDRDELGPLSPDAKRRRFNDNQPATFSRVMAPRYANAPQQIVSVGPGTPFPFPQQPPHPYPPGANVAHVRRESLPGLRGMASPSGAMAPPPRPIMGYQQHRLSQGHIPHDRSLTLPPLQTNSGGGGPPSSTSTVTPATAKSATDTIMNMEFWHKVRVLNQVAPPTPVRREALRGPFVAIEGDNLESVRELGVWLSDTLGRGDDLNVKLLEGPRMTADGGKQKIMAQYHRLAAEWLDKSGDIIESLAIKTTSPTDTVMIDAAAAPATKSATKNREIDEKYDDSDSSTSKTAKDSTANGDETDRTNSDGSSKMNVDAASKPSSISSRSGSQSSAKPVSIIANYSLHASNFFACHIPITAHDPYSPIDHWTWTATQWRGIISPDLTIYVRDAASTDSGKSNVDIMADGNLFAVKRTKAEGRDSMEIEPSVLRRLGFEVGEWVQAFGANAAQ